ncbi:MAG: LacI family DNA-binding transcriptional regulator, partial [Azospirillaceae bacterium]
MDQTTQIPRRVRLQDLAGRCGTSLSTVSRALSGKPGVRPDLRMRILAAAEQAGLMPGAVPFDLKRVVLALSEAAMDDHDRNQFTWHVVDGVTRAAELHGITVVPYPFRGRGSDGLAEAIERADADGLLVLTVDDARVFDRALAIGLPTVVVNGDDPAMRLTSIAPDNRRAAELATRHLIALGHRDIIVIQKPGRRTIHQRVEGWQDAMRDHGLACGADRVLTCNDWLAAEAEAALSARLSERPRDFTAVLCVADCLAIGALRAAAGAGLAVPEALSIVGMDDLPASQFQVPPLTTVHIPAREMGEEAFRLLLDLAVAERPIPGQGALSMPQVQRGTV